jgi:hypothetical protein
MTYAGLNVNMPIGISQFDGAQTGAKTAVIKPLRFTAMIVPCPFSRRSTDLAQLRRKGPNSSTFGFNGPGSGSVPGVVSGGGFFGADLFVAQD